MVEERCRAVGGRIDAERPIQAPDRAPPPGGSLAPAYGRATTWLRSAPSTRKSERVALRCRGRASREKPVLIPYSDTSYSDSL